MTKEEAKIRRQVIDKLNRALMQLDNLTHFCNKKGIEKDLVEYVEDHKENLTVKVIELAEGLSTIE